MELPCIRLDLIGIILLVILLPEQSWKATRIVSGLSLQNDSGVTSLGATDAAVNNDNLADCRTWSCNPGNPAAKPVVCITPVSVVKPLLLTAELTCKVKRKGASISLLVDGKLIPEDDFDKEEGDCFTKFTIKKHKVCYNLRTFSCLASNSFGNTTSNNATVEFLGTQNILKRTIFYVGNVTRSNSDNRLVIGTKGVLTCKCPTCTDDLLVVNFYIENDNGTTVLADENTYKRFEWVMTGTPKERQLVIHNVTESDARKYSCEVVPNEYKRCTSRKAISVKTEKCRPGHYCLTTVSHEIPCPGESYNPHAGLSSMAGCLKCPHGSYCPPGTIYPLRCDQNEDFDRVERQQQFPLSPASKKEECRRCPLQQTCSTDKRCTILCAIGPLSTTKVKETAHLSCRVSSNSSLAKVTLKWTKNGRDISSMGRRFGTSYRDGLFSLRIANVEAGDEGVYKCVGTFLHYQKTQYDELIFQVDESYAGEHLFFLLLLLLLPICVLAILIIKRNNIDKYLQRYFSKSSGSVLTDSSDGNIEIIGQDHKIVNIKSRENLCEAGSKVIEQPEKNGDAVFDAFVCYSNRDKEWVYKQMMPSLESKGIRLCLDFRDFLAGGTILDNIMDAIYKSRKTIAILTPEFLESEWCNYELQNAIGKMEHHVIPIVLRSCEIPNVLKQTTYLDWTDNDIQPVFWERLINAIRL